MIQFRASAAGGLEVLFANNDERLRVEVLTRLERESNPDLQQLTIIKLRIEMIQNQLLEEIPIERFEP